jgi:hypothetical protein
MPASKEYWEQNPGLHCVLLFVAAGITFFIDVGVILNGGFGKWGSPTVTPENKPVLFWLGIGVLTAAAVGILGCGIWRLIQLKKTRRKYINIKSLLPNESKK